MERVHKATAKKCQSEASKSNIQPQPAATAGGLTRQPVDCELKRMEPQRSEVVEVRSAERSGEMSEAACRTNRHREDND